MIRVNANKDLHIIIIKLHMELVITLLFKIMHLNVIALSKISQ